MKLHSFVVFNNDCYKESIELIILLKIGRLFFRCRRLDTIGHVLCLDGSKGINGVSLLLMVLGESFLRVVPCTIPGCLSGIALGQDDGHDGSSLEQWLQTTRQRNDLSLRSLTSHLQHAGIEVVA